LREFEGPILSEKLVSGLNENMRLSTVKEVSIVFDLKKDTVNLDPLYEVPRYYTVHNCLIATCILE
jgi:hypothetical protein